MLALSDNLRSAVQGLEALELREALASRFADAAAGMDEGLTAAVSQQVDAFVLSNNPDILPELAAHSKEHTAEILRLLRNGAPGDLEFVARHARRRADQHFPLDATLHAYRQGHRFYAARLRSFAAELAPPGERHFQLVEVLADFAMEYTDAISTVAARAYADHVRLTAQIAGDQRSELLRILLLGHDEGDRRVSELLRAAGYLDRRRAYCVVAARSVDDAEMDNPARARRLAEAVSAALGGRAWRCLADVRERQVIAVVSHVRRASGWTAPSSSLAAAVAEALQAVGPAALVGVGQDAPSTSHIPVALRQARLALGHAEVDRRVVRFGTLSAPALLRQLAGEEFDRLTPAWNAKLIAADRRGKLRASVAAFAAAHMNLLAAARELDVHPNTLYARFERVSELTGLDAKRFDDLVELTLILRLGH